VGFVGKGAGRAPFVLMSFTQDAGFSSHNERRIYPGLPAALPAAILRLVEAWTLNVRITGSDSSSC